MKSVIYADETGNSGENLLDPEQPIFALSSNDFGAQEATELLAHVAVQKGSEPKFSTLKKTAAGEARLARLLSDPRLNKTRVMVDWMHKPYMVVTKMVDLVLETLYYNDGGDLYENAANVALSNMLFYCMPAFCGKQPTDRFLSAFARLVWKRSETEVAEFFSSAEAMANACSDEEIRGFLLIIGNRSRFSEWFDRIPKDSLNPAIPLPTGTWCYGASGRMEGLKSFMMSPSPSLHGWIFSIPCWWKKASSRKPLATVIGSLTSRSKPPQLSKESPPTILSFRSRTYAPAA